MKTLDEFLEKVTSVRHRLGLTDSIPWFRGHPSVDWTLLPSLLRDKTKRRQLRDEKNIVCDFVTRGGDSIHPYKSSWELLGIMRHYEMPTRLLDWTTSLSVALYFALIAEGDPNQKKTPCLWMLNPHRLNEKTTSRVRVFDSVDTVDLDYFDCLTGKQIWKYTAPIALHMPLSNPRIRAQRGCFTFHGDDLGGDGNAPAIPLEQSGGSSLKKITIPELLVDKLRTLLELEGVDQFFLFPELHMLSQTITLRRRD